ncbi:MAG TPA: DUF2254 domain-containing protein [Terriglobia bacterium]|nr:DUF2254 domain-containing protein [Terriglobia bacterium]
MFGRIRDLIRTSFFFVPMLMITAALVGSAIFVYIDRVAGLEGLRATGWIYRHSPAGARALLQAVAGSMITTAGIAFSIMVVVLALAANQFGSRVLRNYMRDRGNQFTLGMFVATFIYCLMVMRTVHGNDTGPVFVPGISILVAIALVIGSVIVLVYFIHHTTQSIQAENILAAVAREFRDAAERLLPQRDSLDRRIGDEGNLPAEFPTRSKLVQARSSGYLQMIDTGALVKLATEADLCVESLQPPGAFIYTGAQIARYMCFGDEEKDIAQRIRGAFALGNYRTYLQDVSFGIQQIVLIMVRAMSPAINDPFTAMACVDRLGEALALLSSRDMPPSKHFDNDGALRLVDCRPTLSELVESTLAPARSAARNSLLVSQHLLRTLAQLATGESSSRLRPLLQREAVRLVADCEQVMEARSDLEQVQEEYRRTFGSLGERAA